MNDAVMKRKFHAHCPANKDRTVKSAVLSSAQCGHRFAEEPCTEDGEFEHHLPVITLKFLEAVESCL